MSANLHQYKAYADSTTDYVRVDASSADEAAIQAAKVLRCRADYVVVRYVKPVSVGKREAVKRRKVAA